MKIIYVDWEKTPGITGLWRLPEQEDVLTGILDCPYIVSLMDRESTRTTSIPLIYIIKQWIGW
tara:strand:+ start:97 stop:285 length:189 start_codon:yes stop_codon:yes gene_type:complete